MTARKGARSAPATAGRRKTGCFRSLRCFTLWYRSCTTYVCTSTICRFQCGYTTLHGSARVAATLYVLPLRLPTGAGDRSPSMRSGRDGTYVHAASAAGHDRDPSPRSPDPPPSPHASGGVLACGCGRDPRGRRRGVYGVHGAPAPCPRGSGPAAAVGSHTCRCHLDRRRPLGCRARARRSALHRAPPPCRGNSSMWVPCARAALPCPALPSGEEVAHSHRARRLVRWAGKAGAGGVVSLSHHTMRTACHVSSRQMHMRARALFQIGTRDEKHTNLHIKKKNWLNFVLSLLIRTIWEQTVTLTVA